MPQPTEKELKENDRDGFISRCIKFMTDERPNNSNEQNVAMCYSLWRQAKDKEKE